MTESSSDLWMLYAANIFSTGLHFLLAVGLLLVAILAVRKHRRDAWGLFLGSSIVTLTLTVASPAVSLWVHWRMRSHGIEQWVQWTVYVRVAHALVTACATVLLIAGIVKLARPPGQGAGPLGDQGLRRSPEEGSRGALGVEHLEAHR